MTDFPRSLFIVGGARAGKSRYAEALMRARPGRHAVIATGTPGDAEMAERIARHKAERDPAWEVIEEPVDVAAAILRAAQPGRIVLVDCLTLWVANLLELRRDVEREVAALARAVQVAAGPVALVSNEVGLGIVPDNALARAYRDQLGRTNQSIAAAAECVLFMAVGLPLALKGNAPPPP